MKSRTKIQLVEGTGERSNFFHIPVSGPLSLTFRVQGEESTKKYSEVLAITDCAAKIDGVLSVQERLAVLSAATAW